MKKETVLKAFYNEPSIGVGYRDITNVMFNIEKKPVFTYCFEINAPLNEVKKMILKFYSGHLNTIIQHHKNSILIYEVLLFEDTLVEIKDCVYETDNKTVTFYSYEDQLNDSETSRENAFSSIMKQLQNLRK